MQSNITPVSIPIFPSSSTGTQLWVSDTYTGTANMTAQFDWQILDSGSAVLARGNNSLTSDQYSNWGSGSDNSYILTCIATNLGLTLAA